MLIDDTSELLNYSLPGGMEMVDPRFTIDDLRFHRHAKLNIHLFIKCKLHLPLKM